MKSSRKKLRAPAKARRKKTAAAGADSRTLVQLFEINQVELEHQNQELRIAEEELEVSRSKYVNLFDFSPIPYFALNAGGIIKEVNLSGGRLLGLERKKLCGKPMSGFVASDDRGTFKTFLSNMFSSPAKHSCNVRVTGTGGRVFHVLLEGIRSVDALEPEEWCQVALIDLTAYKQLEERLQEVSEELKSLKKTRN